ncbi:unnamed protein product [Hydatigera taeniaeformis]|uniref:Small monomeric GTPase n=1 Tax=Hydatigena taeniaeformis TaxID=6205 RepID=A0A0R3X0X7_HYDTA|nr:unnamed protein product [Hydatigera taeniaeformis]
MLHTSPLEEHHIIITTSTTTTLLLAALHAEEVVVVVISATHHIECVYWLLKSQSAEAQKVNGKACMLEILDTAGSEQFSSLQDLYIRNGQGFVLVYSVASLQSLLDLEAVHQQILRFKAKAPSRQSKTAKSTALPALPPIVLAGNKSDLTSVGHREVAKADGDAAARRWGCCAFVETSAKTGEGVMDVFREVVLQFLSLSSLSTLTSEKSLPSGE